jgi:hypothetical protein
MIDSTTSESDKLLDSLWDGILEEIQQIDPGELKGTLTLYMGVLYGLRSEVDFPHLVNRCL